MPSLSNKVIVTNALSCRNPELFQVDLDVEEEGDLEKIQWEADERIAAVKIHNKKRQLEREDWKQKEEEEWKWKEEEEWKKKEAEKEAQDKAAADACRRQLKVCPCFFHKFCKLTSFPDVEKTKQKEACKAWWVVVREVSTRVFLPETRNDLVRLKPEEGPSVAEAGSFKRKVSPQKIFENPEAETNDRNQKRIPLRILRGCATNARDGANPACGPVRTGRRPGCHVLPSTLSACGTGSQ